MVEWLSFFEGFALDALILSILAVVLSPWMISRWMRNHLFDAIEDVLADPRTNRLIQDYVVKRIAGNFGGRPKGIKGMVVQALVQRFAPGILGDMAGQPPAEPPP